VALNVIGVAKYTNFGPIEGYISETVGGNLVLITNRKSYMSFRLVPKLVTLNDLERRTGPYFALFHRIYVYNVVVKQLLGLPRSGLQMEGHCSLYTGCSTPVPLCAERHHHLIA